MDKQILPFGYDSKVYELTIDGIEYKYRLATPFYIEILQGFQYKFANSIAKKMMEQINIGFRKTLSECAELVGTNVDSNNSTTGIFIKPKDDTKFGFRGYFLSLLDTTNPSHYYFMKIGEVLGAMNYYFTEQLLKVGTYSCFSNLVYDTSDETCIKHRYNEAKVVKRIEYGSEIPDGYIPFFIDEKLNVWILSEKFISVCGLSPF